MTDHAIVLLGGPDSGKTNYLARFWEALRAGEGELISVEVPSDIKYVEDALAHLLSGRFAPRSEGFDESGRSFAIPVAVRNRSTIPTGQIVVPDVSGELWRDAAETCEIPSQWMDKLRAASGALLFLRVGSNQNVEHLDWVNTADLLRMPTAHASRNDDGTRRIPTAVQLCELVRFLEYSLADRNRQEKPRVAVLVTAWDRLDAKTGVQDPMAYLADQYPLFAGRLADVSEVDVQIFGVSIVGGDFVDGDFRQRFFHGDLKTFGYVVYAADGQVQKSFDVTIPVAWVLRGLSDV